MDALTDLDGLSETDILASTSMTLGLNKRFPSQVLTKLSQDLGCVGIWYCYDVTHPDHWHPLSKDRNTAIRRFVRRRRLYASSASMFSLWDQQMDYYHKLHHVMEGLWQNEVYSWPMHALPEPMLRALGRNDVQSLVTITVCCPITAEFKGRFTLLLAGEAQSLTDLELIKEKLQLTQQQLSYQLSKQINPLVDYNIVSPMSVYILKLLVTGHPRSEISNQLQLTAGGINYHLNILKQALGTSSTVQLVYRATQLQLI